ncbi:MAG: Cytochrome c biogenesis ATP-binding export protein CcmA [Gammaproteobacteria bacterium]|nr:Cytochrome c biogenesis ATP-binding export protein CcmA [Gammaproteobacteria bacterium]
MLEIDDLECTRGDRVLFDGLHARAEAGTLLRVNGPNGSGKSSLLRIMCGLMQPTHGRVRWRGVRIGDLAEDYARDLLYIGHRNALKDDLTALENLQIGAALTARRITAAQAAEALGRIGLDGFEDVPARHLSQGQCRRIALARLFLGGETPLWILDEPYTALDARGSAVLSERIGGHLHAGNIVVLTTHQEVPLEARQVTAIELGMRARGPRC